VCDIVVKKFTFAISSPDEFLYRAANAIFGRVGRIASEEVVLHLMSTKCIPILLYGLEACPMRKTDLNSLDFVDFYQTVQNWYIDLVKCCQSYFCCELPSVLHDRHARKFDILNTGVIQMYFVR